jgi:hypothetical protein
MIYYLFRLPICVLLLTPTLANSLITKAISLAKKDATLTRFVRFGGHTLRLAGHLFFLKMCLPHIFRTASCS